MRQNRRFRLPGGDERLTVIGRTGTGKTTFAAWVLSWARFDKRPWIVLDFKGGERLFDRCSPPMLDMRLGDRLPDRGLWRIFVDPGDERRVEALCYAMLKRENIGLFVDECMSMPSRSNGFSALLRQGRSKRIPVIACTQRPSYCQTEAFSEAEYFAVFSLNHPRDRDTVRAFTGLNSRDLDDIPEHACWYCDVGAGFNQLLPPIPNPDSIPLRIRVRAPDVRRWRWF